MRTLKLVAGVSLLMAATACTYYDDTGYRSRPYHYSHAQYYSYGYSQPQYYSYGYTRPQYYSYGYARPHYYSYQYDRPTP